MKSEKRSFRILGALLMCLALLGGVAVSAADSLPCSLTVYTPPEYIMELRDVEYDVSLFKVAEAPVWDGEYVPTVAFKALSEAAEGESESLMAKLNASHSQHDLAALAEVALTIAEELEPDAVLTVPAGEDFGRLQGLRPGLYLLRMEGAETKEWKYSGLSSAVFLPATREEVHDENSIRVHEDTATKLYYDLEIYAKMERERNRGDLIIEKTVDYFENMAQEAVAVFEIKVELEGKGIVYNGLRTLIFNEPGKKTAVVSGLPHGSVATVTEVYSGAAYHSAEETTQTVTIVANEVSETFRPVQVSFKNEGGAHDGGTAVINRFNYNGTGWVWDKEKVEQRTDDSEEWVNPLLETEEVA